MSDERPTFGSLFAGIGGIDLGLERAGWKCRWQVEWDAYCQRVLAKHWPDVPRYGDITQVDWSGVEPVDLIAGGFPCQPFSLAGQRRGKADDRWLWPAFAAAVRALRPRYVLVENVPGILAGHGGMGSVLGDLAELGYDAEWDSIPAAAVGAPHLRYRVWIVAYARSVEHQGRGSSIGRAGTAQLPASDANGDTVRLQSVGIGHVADAHRLGLQVQRRGGLQLAGTSLRDDADRRGGSQLADPDGATRGEPWSPSEALHGPSSFERPGRRSGVLGDADSSPTDAFAAEGGSRRAASESGWWTVEPDVGRVAHGVPARVDRLRSLGNAVVPQVVEVIGSRLLAILEAEKAA